ncbi:MAG: type II toxin-antitoxin system PemK/MazF family toxin [Candidatus Electryoneaceae bacterium]|nr:type II toxin-antitoxin system PemK/MazF family toxin [Candidatus Electryoneaceae bacterium]
MNIKRGDIVLVQFPYSDLKTIKKRPALVVQADDLNTGIPQVIIAMISSNKKRAGHPSRILLKWDKSLRQQTGLLRDSIIITDNLATLKLSGGLILRVIGTMSHMLSVNLALKTTLGL